MAHTIANMQTTIDMQHILTLAEFEKYVGTVLQQLYDIRDRQKKRKKKRKWNKLARDIQNKLNDLEISTKLLIETETELSKIPEGQDKSYWQHRYTLAARYHSLRIDEIANYIRIVQRGFF